MPWRITPERVVSEAGAELAAAFGSALRTVGRVRQRGRRRFPRRSLRRQLRRRRRASDVRAPPARSRSGTRAGAASASRHRSCSRPPTSTARSTSSRSRSSTSRRVIGRSPATSSSRASSSAPEAVRLECEREAKGKLVRLRALYLELAGSTRGDPRAHARLAKDVPARHARPAVPARRRLGAERGRRGRGVRAPARAAVARAVAALSDGRRDVGAIERRFADYLAEIEALAAIADGAGTSA